MLALRSLDKGTLGVQSRDEQRLITAMSFRGENHSQPHRLLLLFFLLSLLAIERLWCRVKRQLHDVYGLYYPLEQPLSACGL